METDMELWTKAWNSVKNGCTCSLTSAEECPGRLRAICTGFIFIFIAGRAAARFTNNPVMTARWFLLSLVIGVVTIFYAFAMPRCAAAVCFAHLMTAERQGSAQTASSTACSRCRLVTTRTAQQQ